MLPSLEICDRARQSRDARFDGLFYTAVRSTKIFCRPVCPAPTPKAKHIVYFPTAAAAAAAGFRPCLRCRPELAPGTRSTDPNIARAIALIEQNQLQTHSIDWLASQVGLSTRHLRRLFLASMGATPQQFYQTQRMLMTKQLLLETALPITEVALAAGFQSIRRFNDAVKCACARTPSQLRKQRAINSREIQLRLSYRPPYDFSAALSKLATRILPHIETLTSDGYRRLIRGHHGKAGMIVVAQAAGRAELLLTASNLHASELPALVRRVRRMFDLDADIASIQTFFQQIESFAKIRAFPGLHIVGAFDGFECAVTTLLRAAICPSKSPALISKLIKTLGTPMQSECDCLTHDFPSPEALSMSGWGKRLGIPSKLERQIRQLSTAVNAQADADPLHFGAGQKLEAFVTRFCAITGADESLAHDIALHALNNPDALAQTQDTKLAERADQWRPWRAYGIQLHRDLL